MNYTSGCDSGSKTTMTLESLTHNTDGVISSGGETFNVGVTLNVNSNQVLGGYNGTYSVQVNYN